VQEEFGVRLTVRDIFDYPTVMQFAQLLDRDNRSATPVMLNLVDEVDNHDLKDAVYDG
jgi:hypothetical protein